jgi:indolepyruvate ferredoxin oxidoreductase alpha subunit
MKQLGDILLSPGPASEIVLGNTALVRGMIEAGTRVVTSYPGSPTPEIASAIASIDPDRRPFYFEFSVNEKVATEVAYGAAVNGHLSTVFFKSVGLNVAADTFVQLNHMNIIGGMVVVLGDDPGANSSQNEQDNRHIARLSYTPVLEPASPREVLEYYLTAADMARTLRMAVILRLTTHVCHAKERVEFGPWSPAARDDTPRFDPANGPYVPITSEVAAMKRMARKRLAEVESKYGRSGLQHLRGSGGGDRGIITAGLPFRSVMDVLEGSPSGPDILKLGLVHPLPREAVCDFLSAHGEVRVVEELDDFLEQEIKSLAFERGISTAIAGKSDPEDWIGEYTPSKVRGILHRAWPDAVSAPVPVEAPDRPAPPRYAQMCPGCGHRSAFYAIGKALDSSVITVADIGCHTLGFLPPYRIGQLLMCMGASNGMGEGLSLFNSARKVVTFLGDSTFFHAGLPGIINAVFNRHDITLVVMENGTTAMTGHQDHPAAGRNFNSETDAIPVRQVLEGLGVRHIWETDTYRQEKLAGMIREALDTEGFSVVIARHPCMLKFTRQQRRKPDYVQRHVSVDQDACRKINECIASFGCPSFDRSPDGTITVNTDLCIGDGSCIQTCPAKAVSPEKAPEGGAE